MLLLLCCWCQWWPEFLHVLSIFCSTIPDQHLMEGIRQSWQVCKVLGHTSRLYVKATVQCTTKQGFCTFAKHAMSNWFSTNECLLWYSAYTILFLWKNCLLISICIEKISVHNFSKLTSDGHMPVQWKPMVKCIKPHPWYFRVKANCCL